MSQLSLSSQAVCPAHRRFHSAVGAAHTFGCLVVAGALLAAGCGDASQKKAGVDAAAKESKSITIAMLPKLKNIAYFDACHAGAKAAAEELGVTLIYDGPNQPSGSEQNQFIETWTRRGVDAICVAPNQPQTIQRFVERAQERGIKILTWDSDAPQSGRTLMVNQVDDQKLGEMLMDEIARQAQEEGEWAVVIASLDAANLNSWRKFAEARAAEKYPKMTKIDTVVTDEDENKARQSVETLLNKYPNLKGMIAFDSNSVPGAAEALKRTGRAGKVALTGNTTPGKMKNYIKDGVLESFFLWDPRALGDLTIRLAKGVVEGKEIQPGATVNGSKPLAFSAKDPTMVILSDPIRFTKENIDQYDWGF